MQDLNHKLATMSTNRETLERLCYTMRDEISEVSNKVDNQSLEIKDCQGALRVQSKMFETQATKMVSQLRKQRIKYQISLLTKIDAPDHYFFGEFDVI